MKLRLVAVSLLSLLCAGTAHADSFTFVGSGGTVQFEGSLTATEAKLTIQCLTGTCNTWYLDDVTLKGFTFTGTPTLGAETPDNFTLLNGGQNNSSGCNSTGPYKAVCWDTNVPLTLQLGYNLLTFTANISDGVADGLHVMAFAFNNPNASTGGRFDKKVMAVSNDLTTQTPEPASLLLLGSGIFGLLSYLKLRK